MTTYDTYLVAEITPDLYGRSARANSKWWPWPAEGTLWRIDLAGGYYAVRIGSHVYEAMADDVVEIEDFG